MEIIFTTAKRASVVTCAVFGLLAGGCGRQSPAPVDTPDAAVARAVYAWADTFNVVDNTQIIDLLTSDSIGEIFVSWSDNTDKPKLKQFLSLAQADSITPSFMFSSSSWFFPAMADTLLAAIDSAFALTGVGGAVHFDIEPQLYTGWAANEALYLSYYVNMLRETRKHVGDSVFLSVSVDPSYPAAYLDSIFSYANRVYCMAYGVMTTDDICARLQTAISTNKKALGVSLRAIDFTNRAAIPDSMNTIAAKTGIRFFAVENLKTFMQLKDTP